MHASARLRRAWRDLKSSPPGARFQRAYRRHHDSARARPYSAAVYAIGGLLIVFGIVSSLLPGIPGFVFVALGGALISIESRRAARLLDRVEKGLHRAWGKLRRRLRR